MSNNAALTPLVGMLLVQAPTLLAYLVGIVFAVIRLQRNPRPAALVLIGCALLFVASLVGPMVQVWVMYNRTTTVASIGEFLMAVNFVLGLVRAAGFVLLIVAAFVARPEAETMPAAFPVGQAAPGRPPIAQRFG